jgi:outer membrane protein OmpA-like peptidoglycan-associated protein
MFGSTTRAAAVVAIGVLGVLPAIAVAQGLERSRAIASSDVLSAISLFNYQERRKSELILRATPVISTGEGGARIEYQSGNANISAEVKRMPPPAQLGPYTTYVLWALTPDGRASNEGVLAGSEGGSGEIQTQHAASQFALIVTAEPHFAVSAPSTMVVLYNVGKDVRGAETKIASLFERADYSALVPIAANGRPVELIQAEYSLAIANATGAKEFVPNQYSAAEAKLLAARTAWRSKRNADQNSARSIAREAAILGEDARRAGLVARADADAKAKADAAAAAERERAAQAAAEQQRATEAAIERAALIAAREGEARARAEARAALLNRLNAVLPTRESERGLVSEIGGVQFATATANLNPPARESLARFSGIVASYPELIFRIEGHTDNVGSDATNNELSLRRAISVRDYLISLGVPASSIEVQGHGPYQPVADNFSDAGRARNRRVEIVISGGIVVASSATSTGQERL